MSRRGLSKRVIEHRTKPLPEGTAQRLQGFNGNMDQLLINLKADILKEYLQEEYGPVAAWVAPLQRFIQGKARLNKWELAAVKRVIKEVNGTEGSR